jgi:hypothetical protein
MDDDRHAVRELLSAAGTVWQGGAALGLLVGCRACGMSYARVLLATDREARCRCGGVLVVDGEPPQFVDREAFLAEERRLSELARGADRVSYLIVATDCPRVDVEIQRMALKRRCAKLFPDKLDLFEMIYESRFRRLWEQFRPE